MEDLDDRVAILTFLSTLMKPASKIHMCFPDNPTKSAQQQRDVQAMIDACKPVTKEKL